MRRGDPDSMYSEKVACCKWLDRCSVLMLFSNIEGMSTTSTVLRQQKGSASKIQVPCPDVIKMYKQGMSGVLTRELLSIIWIVNQELDFTYVYFST